MRRLIIHPTHRRFIRILRDRYKNGEPVVILKKEFDNVLATLPSFTTPTARNQYIYREVLRVMNRPLSEIQHCTGIMVLDKKNINRIESVYAKIERKHLCSTVVNTVELYKRRRRRYGSKITGSG